MESYTYRTLYKGGSGEVIEKKSRFIATLEKIETEQEALAFIGVIKKKYWDASHNCYAFVAGKDHQLKRSNDDGEPSGTAGWPMLELLLREDIHNTVVVVTRYFGGTLLGVGGLVRAYQKAVQEGLKNSILIDKERGFILNIETDYTGIGKLQYLLSQRKIAIADTLYGENVKVKAVVPTNQMDSLWEEITEATNGKAVMEQGEMAEFAWVGKELKIWK